jgi:hypothetical protein
MLTKHQNDWGLGPSLGWDADSLRFGHGGKNAGFTNRMTALNDSMFVDLEGSDEIRFQVPEGSEEISLQWDNRFQFYRITE